MMLPCKAAAGLAGGAAPGPPLATRCVSESKESQTQEAFSSHVPAKSSFLLYAFFLVSLSPIVTPVASRWSTLDVVASWTCLFRVSFSLRLVMLEDCDMEEKKLGMDGGCWLL